MITIGPIAGHHFYGEADLQVTKHATRPLPDGTVQVGYLHSRKRLVNRAAFEFDPRLGWETDRWFEWKSEGDSDATDQDN